VKDGGRISAAAEILGEVEARRRPANLVVQEWGKTHRFAGSGDRAWISGLVLDVLRKRRSLAWRMGDESVRAACLGALRFEWGWSVDRISEACGDAPHGPGPLGRDEMELLIKPRDLANAPAPVRGDYPDWLDASLARTFGEARAGEMAALTTRAPVDLRVNTLKATPDEVLAALEAMAPHPAGRLATTLRIDAPTADLRVAPVEAHPAFARGMFEVQDAGSQIAASMAGDIAGKKVLDLCAGGGGKTLALAAIMNNTGKLYAFDADPRRMRDIIPRAERAGVTNLDVRTPLDKDPLKDLAGAMDLVFVDAPCTGSGVWRRHPDTKWKLKPDTLQRRMAEQDGVLDQAAGLVKPGGRIVYVTCSLLAEEDEDRVEAFFARHPGFSWRGDMVRLTPLKDGTDGFFAAVIERGK